MLEEWHAGISSAPTPGLRTREIGHITQQPYQEELHGQGVCALRFVVGNQLRKLRRVCQPLKPPCGNPPCCHTKRHIQAVKLTLPKIPESACPTSGTFSASGTAAMKGIMAGLEGEPLGSEMRDGRRDGQVQRWAMNSGSRA